jgi:hypothetical protein
MVDWREEENLGSMLFCRNGKPKCNDVTRQQRYHDYPIHIVPRHSCTAGRDSPSNYTQGSLAGVILVLLSTLLK